jgi:heme/copper-type cytochrome/quinol oxidase subunit 2
MIELIIALALIIFALFSGIRILVIGAFILLAIWYFRKAKREDKNDSQKK